MRLKAQTLLTWIDWARRLWTRKVLELVLLLGGRQGSLFAPELEDDEVETLLHVIVLQ